MSATVYVLSNKVVSDVESWQTAINGIDRPLKLSTDRPVAELSGFVPAEIGGDETGFECDHAEFSDVEEMLSESGIEQVWSHVVAFRFGYEPAEAYAANLAAAAYAQLTGGVVFDPQAGALLSLQDSLTEIDGFRAQMA